MRRGGRDRRPWSVRPERASADLGGQSRDGKWPASPRWRLVPRAKSRGEGRRTVRLRRIVRHAVRVPLLAWAPSRRRPHHARSDSMSASTLAISARSSGSVASASDCCLTTWRWRATAAATTPVLPGVTQGSLPPRSRPQMLTSRTDVDPAPPANRASSGAGGPRVGGHDQR